MIKQDTQWYRLQYPTCFVSEEQKMVQRSIADLVDKEILPVGRKVETTLPIRRSLSDLS